jgi:urease accessory protein
VFRRQVPILIPLMAVLFAAAPALAHSGHVAGGAIMGVAHPLLGPDHLLAMLGIGMWAAQRGGSALWSLPLTCLAALALGGAFGASMGTLPGIDALIALTVVVLGTAIAIDARLPTAAGLAAAVLFGAMHGVAHGAEAPTGTSLWLYGAGFVAASGALHAAGVGTSRLLRAPALLRSLGAVVAGTGAVLLGTL